MKCHICPTTINTTHRDFTRVDKNVLYPLYFCSDKCYHQFRDDSGKDDSYFRPVRMFKEDYYMGDIKVENFSQVHEIVNMIFEHEFSNKYYLDLDNIGERCNIGIHNEMEKYEVGTNGEFDSYNFPEGSEMQFYITTMEDEKGNDINIHCYSYDTNQDKLGVEEAIYSKEDFKIVSIAIVFGEDISQDKSFIFNEKRLKEIIRGVYGNERF